MNRSMNVGQSFGRRRGGGSSGILWLPRQRLPLQWSKRLASVPASSNATEKRLINEVYDFARSIAELQLTDNELALYSALVLFQPDRPNLGNGILVRRCYGLTLRSLSAELNRTHHRGQFNFNGSSVTDALISKLPVLREISMLHMDALNRFKRLAPDIKFPELHRELFPTEGNE